MVTTTVVAALSGGCATQAAQTGGTSTEVHGSPPPATSPPARTGLAAIEPCQLLSTVDRSTAGLPVAGVDKTIGTDRACDWTEPGAFGVTVTLDDATALSDLQVRPGTGQKLTVGRHDAIKVSDASAEDGTCAVLLAAGENASVQVDVTNANFRDTTLACGRASTVAQLIEPELP